MARRKKVIEFDDARPMGLGRIVSVCSAPEGDSALLIASAKGLFRIDIPPPEKELQYVRIKKIRNNPVVWLVTGNDGLVMYEEVNGCGAITFLNHLLKETYTDTSLARVISPRAVYGDGVINIRRNILELVKYPSGEKSRLGRIEPFRFIGPFASVGGVGDGFEFIAVHKGEGWSTWLYRLELSDEPALIRVAKAQDPIIASIFTPMPNGDYLIVGQGGSRFETFRVFSGNPSELRPRGLVALPAEAKPVGGIIVGEMLYAGAFDTLMRFKIGAELL